MRILFAAGLVRSLMTPADVVANPAVRKSELAEQQQARDDTKSQVRSPPQGAQRSPQDRILGADVGVRDPTTLVSLLRLKAVRAEIGLEGEAQKQVDRVLNEYFADYRTLLADWKQAGADRQQADYLKKVEQLDVAADKRLASLLGKAQLKRLREISVQVLSVQALTRKAIVEKVGLTKAQSEQITNVIDEHRKRQDQMFIELRSVSPREHFTVMKTRLDAINKSRLKNVLAVLTPEQRVRFEEIKGKPFDLQAGR